MHQGYIEPHVSTAYWSADGRVTVWTSTQGAFQIRSQTAAILGLPEGTVKVIPMEIGGGFGAKSVTYLDPVTAILSKKTGRPVKILMDRKEVFEGSGPTSATKMKAKLGATKDGKITAGQLYLAYEAGAFPGGPIGGACAAIFAPYDIKNVLINAYDVVTNKPRTTAYRAPGAPIVCFAVESALDEISKDINDSRFKIISGNDVR